MGMILIASAFLIIIIFTSLPVPEGFEENEERVAHILSHVKAFAIAFGILSLGISVLDYSGLINVFNDATLKDVWFR